jgi:hypothetical protein
MPETLPTRSAGAWAATQANTPPVPSPRNAASSTKDRPAGTSGCGCSATTTASTAAPANAVAATVRGPTRSESTPPIGRAITAAMAKPAVRVPAAFRSKS